jgi:hypothetical protein
MTPLFQRRLLVVVSLAFGLAGCSSLSSTSQDGSSSGINTLIPDKTLYISKSVQIPLESIVGWGLYIGTAWLILDPLAPNWEIEQASFPDRYYHLSLKMKRVYTGGAGEARVVFHQRAKDLMRENGFDGYTVVEYTEGLESSLLGSQRTARGVIQLTRS